jgi:Xaa-Pro aminopeptidase
MKIGNRLERFRGLLNKKKISAALVCCPVNVGYLTGFTGDSTYLVVNSHTATLVSDSRFATQLKLECGDLQHLIKGDSGTTWSALAEYVNSINLTEIAVEPHILSKYVYDQLAEQITCPLVDNERAVEELRMIKDDSEIAAIRRAIEINERVFQSARNQLRGDQTERCVGHQLENEMRLFGADGCAFPAIVGVGPRSALPHAGLSSTRISSSPFLLIDWGTRDNGYVSDLTRIITTGKVPGKYAKIYDVVLEAQLKAIKKIRAGADCQVVDRAARQHIESAGFGKYFGHGLGHGIGRQVHESPGFSPSRKGTLEAGMVVTVEPGVYLPELGGVRIEDDVLVTKDGCEVLSSLPKDFESTFVKLL